MGILCEKRNDDGSGLWVYTDGQCRVSYRVFGNRLRQNAGCNLHSHVHGSSPGKFSRQDSGTLGRGTSSYICQTMYMKPKGVSLITKEVVAKGVYHVGEESPLTASTCSNAQRNHSASPVAFPSRTIGPIHSIPCLSHISQVVERYRWL